MTTALITGATAGLGRAYAEAIAARGVDLVLVARDTARLDSVAGELARRHAISVEVLPADLADLGALRPVEERLADPHRPIRILVNNAGFGLGKGFLASSMDDEQRLLDVLVRAVLRLTKAVVPGMVERGNGAVVNVSSVAGFAPYGTYGAAKAWVTSFTEGIAVELSGTGVRAVAVCPGFVHTEFHQRADVEVGAPEFAWLSAEDVVSATLAHLDAGRRSPILIPSLRYRAVVTAARHAPRGLVVAASEVLRMRRR